MPRAALLEVFMSLRQALRKAAGLLVEMPPDESEDIPSRAGGTPSQPGAAPATQGESTDALWEALEKASQKAPAAPPVKTVDQIARDSVGPNLDQIKVTSSEVPPIVQGDGSVNFAAIYQSANLPAVPFTAEQIMEMFAALPAELPLESRRQMIKVSISAMGRSIGATPENIVADASRKLAALAAYTDHLSHETNEFVSLSEQKIALLQKQIEETRKSIEAAQHKLTTETGACVAESHRLDDVLEFFSLDVPPSNYAASATQP
jgi:hypothetical protein